MTFIKGIVAALSLLLILASPALAQGISVTTNECQAHFPEEILFRLAAESGNEIKEVTLLFRVAGEEVTNRAKADFQPGKEIQAHYSLNLRRAYLPPGVEIEYWWRIEDERGEVLETDPLLLVYQDDRFSWHEISSPSLSLQWYQGDEIFAGALLEGVKAALHRLSQDTGLEPEGSIKILIYADYEDLMGALESGVEEWVGGRAYPELGIILIGIRPGDLDWGKRALAHEICHLVVHQVTDTPWGTFGLPHWLDEGLACYAEGEMRPDLAQALNHALQEDSLLPLRSLVGNFGADPERAALAYAQSQSVVTFILSNYGPEKMAQLLETLAQGTYYDDALTEVLGVDTEGLEREWQENLERPEKAPQPSLCPGVFGVGLLFWPLLKKGWTPS